MALTCIWGGTFHKSHGSAHASALRSQFGVFFFRYSEEKVAVPACLGALIPEKIPLISQTENNLPSMIKPQERHENSRFELETTVYAL